MITLKDVAKHADVSVMTVSNVVNGKSYVSEKTRARVENAIAALGYRPNLPARNLARGRTGMVTLGIPEVSIPFFAELSAVMLAVAREHGLNLLIEQTGWDRERELELLAGRAAHLSDALLMYPASLSDADLVGIAPGRPTVFVGGSANLTAVNRVMIDNVAAGADATAHLVRTGHTRIALVGPLREPLTGQPNARLIGYRRILAESGIAEDPELLVEAPAYHRGDGYRAMNELLDRGVRVDAVFCMSDLIAIGALRAIRERGLRVPQDIAVVGFDDIEEVSYLDTPLTTIRPAREEMARVAIGQIIRQLADAEAKPEHFVAEHSLTIRDSAPKRGAEGELDDN